MNSFWAPTGAAETMGKDSVRKSRGAVSMAVFWRIVVLCLFFAVDIWMVKMVIHPATVTVPSEVQP